MNKLTGKITQIQKSGAVMLVDISVDGQGFSALLIESAAHPDWLQNGKTVDLMFKETEVSVAKNLSGLLSNRNRMICTVKSINRDELLSRLELNFGKYVITSLITSRAVDALGIKTGDEVEALVKANEVSLMKRNEG